MIPKRHVAALLPILAIALLRPVTTAQRIANNPERPTFANTIEAMERSGTLLRRVSRVFNIVTQSNTNPTLQQVEADHAPKLAAHRDAINLNPKLFARVKAIYDGRGSAHLDAEQTRLAGQPERPARHENGGHEQLQLSDRIRKSSQFNQGFATTAYLGAALLDMAWHSLPADAPLQDVNAFETSALERFSGGDVGMKSSSRSMVRGTWARVALIGLIAGATVDSSSALQSGRAAPQGYITGVVRSSQGPEAGVWVIAETKDLPTNFIKIVVTDDQGRFMVPELPAANYRVWVRGYGLVDSTPIQMKPATNPVSLTATLAKTPQEAAKVYPGDYWLSLLEPPAPQEFPGTGAQGNGLGPNMLTRNHWINSIKSDCNFCHQLGNQLTRSVDHVLKAKPELKTHAEAWEWRLGTGVRGTSMYGVLTNQGKERSLKVYAGWTERVAKGDVPPAPPRPKGIERNLVVTLWDVGDDHSFMHDEASTDKNHPTVNANGRIYAVSAGHGQLVVLDPNEHTARAIDIPTRAPRAEVPSRFPAPGRPSLHWGNEHLWGNPPYDPADPHNPMLDSKGRVWMTSKIRGNQDPSWCSAATNKFAEWFPLRSSGRQASFYDRTTQEFTLIDTCYATHHLQFDNDPDETVYFNELSGPMFGWIDTKVYDQTKDEQKAGGWCGQVLDTNGDGRITKPWNLSAAAANALYQGDTTGGAGGARGRGTPAFDPKLDTMVSYALYSVIPSPVDDTVWGISEQYPGYLVRLQRGNNPPSSCKSQIFKVPEPGFDPRGVDIDSNGVVWTALAASSHLASFDVRKCKDLNGPAKTDGSQCRDGWTLYQTTGPRFKGTDVPADFHYYNWVDQHNISGLGANTPFATGSNSDSLLALNPQTRQWTMLRVPYPLGFYSRGMDGRIDDASAGWKGRALYANYGTHFVWHIEGGKGTKGKIVKFQIRPDPLAR